MLFRGCRRTCSVSVCKSGTRRRTTSGHPSLLTRQIARHPVPVQLHDVAREGHSCTLGRSWRCGREYAMRIWLKPDKVAANNLNGNEVLAALRAQNLQISAGILNQPPVPGHEAYQINVAALGRLSTPDQFGDIVVKSDSQGRVTRVRDIGRVEVGAADYGSTAYMDRSDAAPLLIYAPPGANSLAVEREVLSANEG